MVISCIMAIVIMVVPVVRRARIWATGATSSIRAVFERQLVWHRWIIITAQDTSDMHRIPMVESSRVINRVGVSGTKVLVRMICIDTLPMVVVVIVGIVIVIVTIIVIWVTVSIAGSFIQMITANVTTSGTVV